MQTSPQEIIDFWFSNDVSALWFKSTDEFDAQLKDQFESLWQQAANGDLDNWKTTAEGALALVIILDQFPLNMFRGDAKRYSTEAKSREIAQYAIDNKLDDSLINKQLSFLYLPFMHSEDLNDQQTSIELFEKAGLTDNAKYARHHYGVVERFGRFPHRNIELGRKSTEEEIEYLKHANW